MTRFLGPILLVFCAALGMIRTTPALAQGNIFNPYGNSGYADYRGFGSTKFGNDVSLPGQARIASGEYATGSRYNQFEEFSRSLDGSRDENPALSRGVPTNLPYYQAYQLYDRANKRAYRANDTAADRLYKARLAERNAAYVTALDAKDPKERARLLRELDQDTVKRPLGAITRQIATPDRAARITPTAPQPRSGVTPPRPAAAAAPRATRPTATPSTTPIPPAATPAAAPAAISPRVCRFPPPVRADLDSLTTVTPKIDGRSRLPFDAPRLDNYNPPVRRALPPATTANSSRSSPGFF